VTRVSTIRLGGDLNLHLTFDTEGLVVGLLSSGTTEVSFSTQADLDDLGHDLISAAFDLDQVRSGIEVVK